MRDAKQRQHLEALQRKARAGRQWRGHSRARASQTADAGGYRSLARRYFSAHAITWARLEIPDTRAHPRVRRARCRSLGAGGADTGAASPPLPGPQRLRAPGPGHRRAGTRETTLPAPATRTNSHGGSLGGARPGRTSRHRRPFPVSRWIVAPDRPAGQRRPACRRTRRAPNWNIIRLCRVFLPRSVLPHSRAWQATTTFRRNGMKNNERFPVGHDRRACIRAGRPDICRRGRYELFHHQYRQRQGRPTSAAWRVPTDIASRWPPQRAPAATPGTPTSAPAPRRGSRRSTRATASAAGPGRTSRASSSLRTLPSCTATITSTRRRR